MALHLNQSEREELDKLLYILEQHPWKLRALVAENIKLRQLLSSVRKYHRYQHAIVQHQMDELPRANDAGAWENTALDSLGESTG
jgi:hypothetical protein